ncbi:MAG: preprotein translocase subunit SecG [Sphingomonadaceae bacterium]|nr:preprotein translocase subunit SecG [Sphingomonadaceae bacterium]
MFTFLLVVHALIAASLVAVILMQRSEGGGLGTGSGNAGLMTARGAADFLTRTTAILAVLFVGMSIVLAAVAGVGRAPSAIDTSFARQAQPLAPVTGGVAGGAAGALPGVLPSGVPGVPAPGAPGVPAPSLAPLPTAPGSAGAGDQKSDHKKGDKDQAGTSSNATSDSGKKSEKSSDKKDEGSKKSETTKPSSSLPEPVQLRATPKIGVSGSGGSISSTSASAPSSGGSAAPKPSAAPAPVTIPAPSAPASSAPASSGSGNGQ